MRGSMGTRVGEALDDLAAKEMIAGGYSKRVKKFFGVQDAVS